MRRFEVWLDKNIVGTEAVTDVVELPDDVTQEQIDEACSASLDNLIGNELDTGWREIFEEET